MREWFPKASEKARGSLRVVNEQEINYELLERLLEYICKTGEEGAILVFLPVTSTLKPKP